MGDALWAVLTGGGWGFLTTMSVAGVWWAVMTGRVKPHRRRGFGTLDGIPEPTMTAKEFLLAQVRQETPEQLVDRMDAANVRDWEQQWAALAGHSWAEHLAEEKRLEWKREMTAKHERATEHQRKITEWEERRQTRILERAKKGNHFGESLTRAFSKGGVIDMGSVELEVTWGKDKPKGDRT